MPRVSAHCNTEMHKAGWTGFMHYFIGESAPVNGAD